MEILKWLIPALTGMVQLAMNTINTAQQSGEMTAEEAQAHRDHLNTIWQNEYARTDAERGRTSGQ
jgi:hypothetical protein